MIKQVLLVLLSLSPLAAARPEFAMEDKTPYSADTHYNAGIAAFENKDWEQAIRQLDMVIRCGKDTTLIPHCHYWKGVAFFNLGEFKRANDNFDAYLERDPSPKYFQVVHEHKLAIAEGWRKGRGEHLLHQRRLPRWLGFKYEAVELYDEVFTAMPSHELAVQALYGKGWCLWDLQEYEEATDCFAGLIARFPKHAYAPESYLAIAQIHLDHARNQPHNPDLLPLAQINLRKFRSDFPTDDRVTRAELALGEMKGCFADALVETGRFYEQKKKPEAACVYYAMAMDAYEGTSGALLAEERYYALQGPPEGDVLQTISAQDIAVADLFD